MFAVLLEDDPLHAAAIRQRVLPDHLSFLDRSAAHIRFAGPLQEPSGGAQAGGLWVVQAADAAEAERLVHEDPFWAAGLRRSVRILEWRQVFAEGRRC